jgi:hypothetical protein
MLPMPKKAAGLVFNDDGECIAMYSHSGEKDQFNKKDAAGLVFNDNGECIAMYSHSGEIDQLNNLDFLELMPESRHKEFIHQKLYCMICHLKFDKDVVFKMHNEMIHNLQHSAKVIQEKCRLLKQKEETISNLQKKIVENGKYTKQLEESVEKTSLCTICVEERRNLIFFPCMHIVACARCGNHQTITRCPICRMNITEKQKVIIS